MSPALGVILDKSRRKRRAFIRKVDVSRRRWCSVGAGGYEIRDSLCRFQVKSCGKEGPS